MPPQEQPPQNILVVGGGSAGWMVANELQHAWGNSGSTISVVESVKIGTVGVGEGTTPSIRAWFRKLGISEQEWMPACNATYKCGISFPGWSTIPGYENYFHPFYSALDTELALKFFDNCNYRRAGHDVPAHPDDYFVTTGLARDQRSPIPRKTLGVDHDYGYHFDAALMGNFLRDRAVALGVNHITDTISSVQLSRDGDVEFVRTEAHGDLHADFFVDCSGMAGLIVQKALGEPLKDYKSYLRNNAAVAIPTPLPNPGSIPSETVSRALSHGWAWHIPLMNRFGNGYVYCSDYIDAETAENELRACLGLDGDTVQSLHLNWQPGRIDNHWKGNCLAVGLSQGFLEPLEAAMLNITQFSIEQFVSFFQKGGFCNRYQEEFNSAVNQLIDGVRDYLQLHYKLNSRDDTRYWRDCRDNPNVSTDLEQIIQAWDSRDSFDAVMREQSMRQAYKRTSWYCLLAGMGRFPSPTRKPKGTPDKYIAWLHQQTTLRTELFLDHATQLSTLKP